LEFGNVGFSGTSKIGVSGEKPSEQGENQQQPKRRPESKLGHTGGRRVFSPLHQPCFLGNVKRKQLFSGFETTSSLYDSTLSSCPFAMSHLGLCGRKNMPTP